MNWILAFQVSLVGTIVATVAWAALCLVADGVNDLTPGLDAVSRVVAVVAFSGVVLAWLFAGMVIVTGQ